MYIKSSLISVALFLCGTEIAGAEGGIIMPTTPAQRQCIQTLQHAGAQVANQSIIDTYLCVSKVVNGKIPASQIKACLATESLKLTQAKAKTIADASKMCTELATVGPSSAAEVNAAFSNTLNLTQLFGTNFPATLQSKTANAKVAQCQFVATSVVANVLRAELAEYDRCTQKKLNDALPFQHIFSTDLEACIGNETAAIKAAKQQAMTRIASQCTTTVPSTTVIHGQCANVTPSKLSDCIAAQAKCDATLAINVADHTQVSGHQFKDGITTYYCGTKPTQTQSVARQWDEEILSAIRIDTPRPPVHARNLFHMSAAMYDAWATYDSLSKPFFTQEHLVSKNVQRDRDIAVSFAAYRILADRYSQYHSINSTTSLAAFSQKMVDLGFDTNYTQTTGYKPAAVGNRIAKAILDHGMNDGSKQSDDYRDSSYTAVNKFLNADTPGIDITDSSDSLYLLDPNHWQPLHLNMAISQNGIFIPGGTDQVFIGSHWGEVEPFAMTKTASSDLYFDPGHQPVLGGQDDTTFKNEVLDVITLSSWLTPDDPTQIDISPAGQGANTLGTNNGKGHTKNPVTGKPYSVQSVKRGDFGRILAEWWADGPKSETPPGHWNLIANSVADAPGFKRQIGGTGQTRSQLEWDVKTYFALNGATHDAAIAAWGIKRKYDGARPITMIRYMAELGQSSNPNLPSYNTKGLPLKEGVVELITNDSSASGQRHAKLVTAAVGGHIGDIAIRAWPGSPEDTKNQYSGVKWVLGKAWVPYQRRTFVTPAFPGYISGHSTFSRAAAEVLAAITGTPYFPGGLYEQKMPKNVSLIHERGPSKDVNLQWATYFDASDQSGRSRLWGGIHVAADDFSGRIIGHKIGQSAFSKAVSYFNGSPQ